MDFQDVKSAVLFTDVGPLLPSAGSLVEEQHIVWNYLLQLLFSSYHPLLDLTGANDFFLMFLGVFIMHTWTNKTLLTVDFS